MEKKQQKNINERWKSGKEKQIKTNRSTKLIETQYPFISSFIFAEAISSPIKKITITIKHLQPLWPIFFPPSKHIQQQQLETMTTTTSEKNKQVDRETNWEKV